MNKLFFALITLSSFAALQASNKPPCNHESLDEAWDNEEGKDDNHCGHHHHCG